MIGQTKTQKGANSSKLLITIGLLWFTLASALLIFQLTNPAMVEIEWDTATEVDAIGFFLYRSQSPDGEFVPINEDLIPSKGDAFSGAKYTFTDDSVQAGKTYYYILEEIEHDSTTNRYEDDMFAYTVPHTWWIIVLAVASALVGLALLLTGLKEGRIQ